MSAGVTLLLREGLHQTGGGWCPWVRGDLFAAALPKEPQAGCCGGRLSPHRAAGTR